MDQQPVELAEERREIRDILMENRAPPQTKLEMRVHKNKLMLNNQMYKKLITSQAADILRLHVDEIEAAQKVKLIKGDTIIEKDSEFISMAHKVCTMEEVRLWYRKMRTKYRDGTHIMCAYRLNDPRGPYNQNSADNREYGAGRTLLKYL